MANKHYTHASTGQRYADVVTFPSRGITAHVKPPAPEPGQSTDTFDEFWTYECYDANGDFVGSFEWNPHTKVARQSRVSRSFQDALDWL